MAKKQTKKQSLKLQPLHIVLIAVAALALIIGAAGLFRGSSNSGTATATHYVQIDIQDYGTITAELYGDVAPITVANFMELVDSGFYDGLTFHRIISGFMIQGGDPLGNGLGGSDKEIKGEFAQNGVKNDLKHTRGVLSMARSSNPNSASSQFFIMHPTWMALTPPLARCFPAWKWWTPSARTPPSPTATAPWKRPTSR